MKPEKFRKLTDKMAFCAKVFNKLHLMSLSIQLFKLKDKIVLDYIEAYYADFIKNYVPKSISPKKIFDISPVFVCWLQGEENAPDLVKKCIASIKKHSGKHQVVVITEQNLSEYIEIPSYIIGKVKSGQLTRTSFSDIVRSALLASYGGMWIDATFYITKDLPESYFDAPIFSAAKQPEPKNRRNVCISHFRWTGSFIGCAKNNYLLFCFLRDFFYEYETKEVIFIDYLLVDYMIFFAYSKFSGIKEDIDKIPDNNIDFGWLFHVMNKPVNIEKAHQMFNSDTFTYKLSWKMKWKRTVHGKKSYYSAFLDGDLNNV